MRSWTDYPNSPLLRASDENETEYVSRIAGILPFWPREAIVSWLFPHNSQVIEELTWIGLQRLRFRLETWSTDRIIREVRHGGRGVEIEQDKCSDASYRDSLSGPQVHERARNLADASCGHRQLDWSGLARRDAPAPISFG